MKSPSSQQKEKSTTAGVSNIIKLPIKHNNHSIKHISSLAADHDVKVSGTMIKVTYKKPMKDQLSSSESLIGLNINEALLSNSNNLHNSVKKIDVFMNENKSSKIATGKKSGNVRDSVTISKNKRPIYISRTNNHPLYYSAQKPEQKTDVKRRNVSLSSGLSLLKKFEELKEISGLKNSFQNSVAMNSRSPVASVSATAKPNPMRATTSEKDQGPPANIKIPKGITIIRVKSNASTKNDKVLKKGTTCEKVIVNKDRRKGNTNLKRKMIVGENVVATKIIRKSEQSSLPVNTNKQYKNFSDITDLCETIISEDMSEDNSFFNTSGSSKKEILFHDPDLPPGWKRVVHTKYEGTAFAKHVVYIYSPQGKKFQFKWKLRRYLEKTKSQLSAEQFHFGLYKRSKSIFVSPANENDKVTISLIPQVSKPKAEAATTLSRSMIATKAKAFNLKHSNSVSRSLSKSRLSHYKLHSGMKKKHEQQPCNDEVQAMFLNNYDKKELLLYDPDLPFGWKRIINANSSTGKLQVNIISPEGRIFRRRYRLHEYLTKHQYNHSLDRFYFGLYPKKDPMSTNEGIANGDGNMKHNGTANDKTNGKKDKIKGDDDAEDSDLDDDSEELILSEGDMTRFQHYATPMYFDPNLPKGWQRFIKIRHCGRNAGKIEVVLVSPEGKRFRSKGQLENFMQKNDLHYNLDDFDFSVFGRGKKQSQAMESKEPLNMTPKRTKALISRDRPVPDLDINGLKETKFSPEEEMINSVSGLMISCQLSSGRSERRLRVPRKEHEKNLKIFLASESEIKFDEEDISPSWVQKLVKCRSDFRNLEPDAAALIAKRTKEFLQELSLRAMEESADAKMGLQYDDVANVVEKYETLASLKTLIPKKITYKEFVKLNRPKQFLSFT